MSAVPSIIAAEADLARRLQRSTADPLQSRVDGHDRRLDLNDDALADYGNRIVLAESTLLSQGLRIAALEGRPLCIVQTERELLDAIRIPQRIYVAGTIFLSDSLLMLVAGVKLMALWKGCGLVFPHDPAGLTARTVVKLWARDIELDGLDITTGHPLTTHTTCYDTGIEIATDGTIVSCLRIRSCRVHHIMDGIVRWAGSSAPYAEDVRIEDTDVVSFGRHGIFGQAKIRGGRVSRNRIFGREYGETHPQVGNGIWWGNYADYFEADDNEIAFCGRHAFEFWNSQDSPTNTNGNLNALITRQRIHDMLNNPESFGISAFGNGVIGLHLNEVDGCTIGIETYGDKTNTGFIHCSGNKVRNWGQVSGRAHGISVNGVRGGKYCDNFIGAPANPYAHNNTQGMLVINGGSDLEITENRFQDAGVCNIMVFGKVMTITGISQAADGVFTVSAPIDTSVNNGWAVGKRIYLTGIGGMTALNDKYYTITFVSGSTFKLGVDTSAMPAYTSGGRVMEQYDNLTIDNNRFRRSVVPGVSGNTAFKSPLWVFEIQKAVITNNRSWVKSGLGLSTFAISDWGTVYVGPTDATTVTASSPSHLFALQSTNIEVTFAP